MSNEEMKPSERAPSTRDALIDDLIKSKAPKKVATPRTDVVVAPYIGLDGTCVAEANALLDHARELERELAKKTAEVNESHGYLSRLLLAFYPNIEPLPNLPGLCTQVDNGLAVPLKRKTAEVEDLIHDIGVQNKQLGETWAERFKLEEENAQLKQRLDHYERRSESGESVGDALDLAEENTRLKQEVGRLNNVLASLREFVASDAIAVTYQSMGRYRTSILKALCSSPTPS